jgi:hypothetical protein
LEGEENKDGKKREREREREIAQVDDGGSKGKPKSRLMLGSEKKGCRVIRPRP